MQHHKEVWKEKFNLIFISRVKKVFEKLVRTFLLNINMLSPGSRMKLVQLLLFQILLWICASHFMKYWTKFPKCSAKEEVCDGIRNEWLQFQMESTLDSHFSPRSVLIKVASVTLEESVLACRSSNGKWKRLWFLWFDTFIVSSKKKTVNESCSAK